MNSRSSTIGAYIAGGLSLAILTWFTATAAEPVQFSWVWLVFIWLFVFSSLLGIPVSFGYVSPLPLTTVATCLTLGSFAASWIAVIGEVVFGLVRLVIGGRSELLPKHSVSDTLRITLANLAIQSMSIFIAGQVYHGVGGVSPLQNFDRVALLQFFVLGVTYLLVNYILIAAYMLLGGRKQFIASIISLPRLSLYEGLPLVFAPFMTLVYVRLGVGWWLLFCMNFGITSLFVQNLISARNNLERRVKELAGLQAVGRVISSSLNLDKILEGIYQEVSGLMPANVFYVALYDTEGDEDQVDFPLVIENGERLNWGFRRAGNGLTEFVLRSGQTLLIPTEVQRELDKLGINAPGIPARSWLGVPILAGNKALGMISVQSYTDAGIYNENQARLLETIAAQAAVAIQNARLYERTDEALARRVRELNSILRTTSEGIMLVDLGWRVVAINPALARLFGNEYIDIRGREMDFAPIEGGRTLISQVGYSLEDLQLDCDALAEKKVDHLKQTVRLRQNDRAYERTLTPVRDRQSDIIGWLLVFRDITEEVELARLREDMIHMLVHDLRSPLATLLGSLNMLAEMIKPGPDSETLLNLAQRGGNRLMRLVNDLLELSRLEDGQLVVQKADVNIPTLLKEVVAQLQPLAIEDSLLLQVSAPADLPSLPGDPELLSRVLYNLVDNAIKFTQDGGVIEVAAQAAPPLMVISVADNGPGILEGTQDKIFNKFQRNPGTKGRRKGTGLGLYFCRLAVEAHNGRIWVESESGQGCVFKFSLPLKEES